MPKTERFVCMRCRWDVLEPNTDGAKKFVSMFDKIENFRLRFPCDPFPLPFSIASFILLPSSLSTFPSSIALTLSLTHLTVWCLSRLLPARAMQNRLAPYEVVEVETLVSPGGSQAVSFASTPHSNAEI